MFVVEKVPIVGDHVSVVKVFIAVITVEAALLFTVFIYVEVDESLDLPWRTF